MATMGKYCKAYSVHRLRQFPEWNEKRRPETAAETPKVLGDDDYLFVQHNLVVTDGIFVDQNIIFDDVTPAWQDFCKSELRFEIPDYVVPAPPSEV